MSELPEGWAECTLGDLLQPERGIFDGPFGSSLKTVDYVDEGVRVIRLENVATYEFIDSKRTWISREKFQQLRKHEVRPGDLIVGSFVDDRVRVCLLPTLDTPAIAKADCFCLRPRSEIVDPRFLMYQLGLPTTRSALVSDIHGATRPRVTTTQLKGLTLALPPLAEQRRIVDKVEALLANVQRSVTRAGAALHTLSRIEDAAANSAADGSLVAELVSDSIALSDVLREPLVNGRSVVDRADGFPVLRLNAVTRRGMDLSQRKAGAWSAAEARRFLVAKDDFLIARGNGSLKLVGRGALVRGHPDPVAYPDTLIRVRTDREKVRPAYLEIIWNSVAVRRQIESVARTTAGIHKISQRDLEAIQIPCPEAHVQDAIVRTHSFILERIDRALARTSEAFRRAGALSSALLAKAFAGELVPTEAELARREGRSYEPASVLLDRIRAERASAPAAPKRRRAMTTSASRGARSPRR